MQIPEQATATIEVISTAWWQIGKTQLGSNDPIDANDPNKPQEADSPIVIKLQRGQPVDIKKTGTLQLWEDDLASEP